MEGVLKEPATWMIAWNIYYIAIEIVAPITILNVLT